MILTDIQVPALGRTYDFFLDEDEKIAVLLAEIVRILRRKAGAEETESETADLSLFRMGSRRKEILLSGDSTLRQNGISDGDQLFLV